MSPKLAVVLGLVLLVVIGFAFHWWILDVRRIWDWLVYAEPADLPGPDRTPAPWAGEHHPTPDEWEQLDPDEAADVWVAELHEDLPGPAGARVTTASEWSGAVMPTAAGDGPLYPLEMARAAVGRAGELHLEPWLERAWWDDPDLVVWDAKRQAARCWEILHVEFPRLRAELCGAAA